MQNHTNFLYNKDQWVQYGPESVINWSAISMSYIAAYDMI